MHCRSALRHLHARADGPMVEQVECQVQLQHRSTISRAHLLERIIVEPVPKSPVGVSPFLFRPPNPLGPLAPPLALLSPAPAANIAHKDEDVVNRMGRLLARGSLSGRSAPCGKIPSRPHVVVGDGINRPLFLHLPQQYHPMHCRPALRNSHSREDGPVMEQVECPTRRSSDLFLQSQGPLAL